MFDWFITYSGLKIFGIGAGIVLALSAQQCYDALCLHYYCALSSMPASCDGYGGDFSLTHALDCHKDGVVTQCHNEVRDVLGDLAALGI